jgi:hypothetical protein
LPPLKSRRVVLDEAGVALAFPDDFPFNRRSREPEAPMKPQEQVQPQVQLQAPRVRPAAPEGARASAAASTPTQQMPMPVFAEDEVESAAPAAHVVPSLATAPAIAKAAANTPVMAVYPRAQERRRSPRQTLVAKAVVRSEFNQTTVATGFLSNISMLGVGFHTRRPLTVGEKFQMRLELGPMKWATRLRVVSCQPHDAGTFDVGAEFIGNDLGAAVQRVAAA